MKFYKKLAGRPLRTLPVLLLILISWSSCGGENTEVATQYTDDETTEANTFKNDEQIPINERDNFENHQAVSVTIDNPKNFNWTEFKDGFEYKNPEESEGDRIVSNWIDWGEYQYKLQIIKTDRSLELLTFLRMGNDPTANEQLLTMEVADDLKLSSLWIQMENLAVDLESNLDSRMLLLKSDI